MCPTAGTPPGSSALPSSLQPWVSSIYQESQGSSFPSSFLEASSSSYSARIYGAPAGRRNTDSHESLSSASRMTLKMDILEGFLLALLTQLNAYSIIAKGKKRMFSGKKKVQPKHKNTSQNLNKLHTFLQIIYGGIGCCAQASYKDRVVYVHKSRILPRSLIFSLRESNRKSCCRRHWHENRPGLILLSQYCCH